MSGHFAGIWLGSLLTWFGLWLWAPEGMQICIPDGSEMSCHEPFWGIGR